jgi:hypothetical protein
MRHASLPDKLRANAGTEGDDTVDSNDPVAAAAVDAIRTGDTTSLASLLS